MSEECDMGRQGKGIGGGYGKVKVSLVGIEIVILVQLLDLKY